MCKNYPKINIGDIVCIKNPVLAFQRDLRYKVTKVNKHTIRCKLVEYDEDLGSYIDVSYSKEFCNVRKNVISVC